MTNPFKQLNPLRYWLLVAMLLTLSGFVANCFLGSLNQDEGWYLYAARQVLQHRLPQIDFFYTQGSFMPFFYAAFAWFWSPMGILGGRIFTALLSFTALLIGGEAVGKCCRRPADRWIVRLSMWSLLGLNLYHSYYTAIPKSYALCLFLMSSALWLLSDYHPARGLHVFRVLLAGVCVALLADVRVSQGILLLVIGLWLLYRRSWAGKWAWFWFGIGGGLGLLLAFGPQLIFFPDGLFEAQQFHAGRLSMGLIGRLGCMGRALRFYPLQTVGAILLCFMWFYRRSHFVRPGNRTPLISLWFSCALVLGAVHLLAPVPYDDYQVPTMFILSMCISMGVACLQPEVKAAAVRILMISAVALTMMGSQIAENWFAIRQDRFFVELKEEPDLLKLRRVAAVIKELVRENSWPLTLATQDVYLAVEAGMDVPQGFEMGPFGFTQDETASKYYLKASQLQRPATYGNDCNAAWSGYAFLLDAPSMADLRTSDPTRDMQRVYTEEMASIFSKPIARIPDFGQQHTTLILATKP